MPMQALVSIITVNYNQAEITCALLRSLRLSTYQKFEVIVVDNASTQDPAPWLAAFPEVRLIRSPQNLGFAGGNNLGIAAAQGDYLFFVNNDTEFTPDLLARMLAAFGQAPDIGVVSPKIRYYHQPNTIQYAGATAMNPYTARNATIGLRERDNGQHDWACFTHYAHGAAMMVRREVINRVGPMPEAFFLYYEELDWCEQIKRAGYRIFYAPQALIYHKESVSVGKMSTLKTYYMTRNRILFMRRNYSSLQYAIFMVFLFVFTVPKSLIGYLRTRQFAHIKAFAQGIWWNVGRVRGKI